MKNILYLLLFLFPVLGHSQIFVAEFDNIVSGTPVTGAFSAIGVFSDNDGYGNTPADILTTGVHYFIDAGGQEYVIVAKSGSSPLTIEFDPINGAGVPELGIGQLTSKTNNQYHMTAGVGDLTRTKILNLNIQSGGGGSGVDSASYASDTLYLFLEGTIVAKTKVSPAITTFTLDGTTLRLALANGSESNVDLASLGTISSPAILLQDTDPTSSRVFQKKLDTLANPRVLAPYGNEGYKPIAYYDDIMSVTSNLYQGKAILDTIPLLAGIDQTRLDSMNLIGISHGTVNVQASTAARDSLYPDGFVIALHGSDSMIVAYSGIIVFPDSVFDKGVNYYQPYDYIKYQSSPDTILEQLVFKALDTNVIEIRDRYSYLAENKLQSDRSILPFQDTNSLSNYLTNNEVLVAYQLRSDNPLAYTTGIVLDSLKASFGTYASNRDYDLIPNAGNLADVNVQSNRIDFNFNAGFNMRNPATLNDTISIIFMGIDNGGGNDFILTELGGATTGLRQGDGAPGIWRSSLNGNEQIIENGFRQDSVYIYSFGWSGVKARWNIKRLPNAVITQSYDNLVNESTNYETITHPSSVTIDQIGFNLVDDAAGSVYKWIIIFNGELTNEEFNNVARRFVENSSPTFTL